MEASVCIEQKGIVEEITDHRIRVRIHRESACGHCSAQGMCNLADISERIIEATDDSIESENRRSCWCYHFPKHGQ